MLHTCFLPIVLSFSSGGGTDGGGQSCDAINICKPYNCPVGMTKVAPPERSDTYSISAPTSEWVPLETVSITIAVEKKRIQRRQNKGVYVCYCDRPWRHRLVNDCKPHVRSASEHERSREPRAASGILAL